MTKPNPTPICPTCNLKFYKSHKRQRYCSFECALSPRTIRDESTGCLEWQGTINNQGYGSLNFLEKRMYVHRAVYFNHHQNADTNLFVCHKCDNRKCCEITHLFLGTQKENMQDMSRKGRQWTIPPFKKGEAHYKARLKEKDVLAIRADPRSSRLAAETFGVSARYIREIREGRKWGWLK